MRHEMHFDNHIDTTPGHGHGAAHGYATLILWICAGFFTWLEHFTADDLYTWSLRALTVISVSITIFINWNKALDIYKAKRKKKHDNSAGHPPKGY
jgi:hypothetical protein